MYTTQGDLVCIGEKHIVEGFAVREDPNEPEIKNGCKQIKKEFLEVAKKYDCDVNVDSTMCKFDLNCNNK
jgi:hypothetical protein